MDSFEINKIVAAVLMVALLVIGIGKLSNVIFHVEKPKTPGYAVEVEQAKTVSSSTETAVEEKIDIAALMAMGDVNAGKIIFKKEGAVIENDVTNSSVILCLDELLYYRSVQAF